MRLGDRRDLNMAKELGAQFAAIKAEWPKGAVVTRAVCLRAAQLGADFDWAAKHLLTATAWETYEKAAAPAWETYKKATAPARETYEKATGKKPLPGG